MGKPQPERENLAGLVERVTFHNEESGFSVLRVEARGQRDLITVVGHAATIGAGEFVQASGRWVNDRTQASSSAAISWALPTAVEGIEKYVASRMWCRSDVAKPSTSTFFLMLSRVSGSRDAEGQVPRNLQASPQQLREQQHDAKAS